MDTQAEADALDRFGEFLVKQVRDEAIWEWTEMLAGRMKGDIAERLRPKLSRLDPSTLALIGHLVPQIIDTTLHYLLWTLEQDEAIDIAVTTKTGRVPSLREVSDGLAGELFDWIPRFSDQGNEES